MNFQTNTPDRRGLVKALAQHFELEPAYNGPPTFSYSVGGITVQRDGMVTVEDTELAGRLRAFLAANGFLSEMPAAFGTDDFEAESTKPTAVTDSGASFGECIDRISVSVPLANCTPAQLINILRTIYARQTLIAAMTRFDFIRMDEEVITLLSEAQPESIEKISQILRSETAIGMVSGIAIKDGNLKMDTTYNREDPTGWNGFANLLLAMADKAMKAHHVSSKRIEPTDDEMKYFCRSWLMQLGMGGAEFKTARATLLNHLQGFAAFRTADKMNAHKAKYTERRRELREERNREQNDA